MKSSITVLLVLCAFGCYAEEKRLTDENGMVTYSVSTSIETNTLEKSVYDTKTNGYSWVVNASRFPEVREQPKVVNYGLVSFFCTNLCLSSTGSVAWVSYNQWCERPPDPFQEKVTAECFIVVSVELYTIHVGPMAAEYARKYTVIKRWQTIHRQKLNMTESTETKEE